MEPKQFRLASDEVRAKRPSNFDITDHTIQELWTNPLFQLVRSEAARLADKYRLADPRTKDAQKLRDDILIAKGLERFLELFDDAIDAVQKAPKNKEERG